MLCDIPSNVDKEVLRCLVDVENLISVQAKARTALQGKFPKIQRSGISVQYSMAKNKTN